MPWKQFLLDTLFPPLCLGCERTSLTKGAGVLCADCESKIQLYNAPTCILCGNRLAHATKACHPKAPYLLAAACDYKNAIVQKLIWQLKFKHRTLAAPLLAKLLAAHLRATGLKLNRFVIMPIPLHPSRQRKRGFNQSELIAQELAKLLGLPIRTDVLAKIKNTKPQTEIKTHESRRTNLIGAFSARPMTDNNILLVDDVVTTGSTLAEAAAVLRAAGAEAGHERVRVISAVVAKA